MDYDFELKFKLPPDNLDIDELIERLSEAGCDDALIGSGLPGRIALQFTREGESAQQAIVSALQDVKKVIPTAQLIEVGPDFAGLTDVAELVGVTHQNIRKLMLAHAESFPAPVHEGSAALWHLAPVLQWLKSHAGYSIERAVVDVAHVAMQINLAKEARCLEKPIQREVQALVT